MEDILPGSILYLHCPFTIPNPKNKYVLLLKLNRPSLIFVINSDINRFIQSRPELYALQMRLPASAYTFFDHDSFVNCSEVKDNFLDSEIVEQLTQDPRRNKGILGNRDIGEVKRMINLARTISQRHKHAIISSLS